MPLSGIVNGKVLDHKYVNQKDGFYAFFLGDMCLGQIVKNRRGGWCAIPIHTQSVYGKVEGFRTREDAAEFILQVCRVEDYYDREEKLIGRAIQNSDNFEKGSVDISILRQLIKEWADKRDEHSKSGEECREKKMIDVWREQRGYSMGYRDCIEDLFGLVEKFGV